MNLLATTTLIAVEQQATKVGYAMGRTEGPTECTDVPEIAAMTEGLAADDPIVAALRKGYLVGYASATMTKGAAA